MTRNTVRLSSFSSEKGVTLQKQTRPTQGLPRIIVAMRCFATLPGDVHKRHAEQLSQGLAAFSLAVYNFQFLVRSYTSKYTAPADITMYMYIITVFDTININTVCMIVIYDSHTAMHAALHLECAIIRAPARTTAARH